MSDGDDNPLDFSRDMSRRELIRLGGGLSVFGVVVSLSGCSGFQDFEPTPMEDMEEVEVEPQGLQYFTIEQARLVHALTARIYPSDENGPGAPEAGVVYFIDRQMDSAWGHGERWYMQGPFAGKNPTEPFESDPEEAEEDVVPWGDTTPAQTQGWQYPLTPNEAYDQGIAAIREYVEAEYDGAKFRELDESQQDDVVAALEDDDVDTFEDLDLDPSGFFLLVRQNTLEGMFSDPAYGGNREMVGWRLKGFPGTPGALGSYREQIDQGEYIELEEGDYRKLADDVESLGIGEEGNQSAENHEGTQTNAESLGGVDGDPGGDR